MKKVLRARQRRLENIDLFSVVGGGPAAPFTPLVTVVLDETINKYHVFKDLEGCRAGDTYVCLSF